MRTVKGLIVILILVLSFLVTGCLSKEISDQELSSKLEQLSNSELNSLVAESKAGVPEEMSKSYQASNAKVLEKAQEEFKKRNQAPILTEIGGKKIDENSKLSFIVSAADTDGDLLTYTAESLPTGAGFNVETKTFSWKPGYGQAGIYQVVFKVSDGFQEDSEIVTISVGKGNRVPVLSFMGNKEVKENELLSFVLSADDPDGDQVTYSVDNLPSGATLVNGVFTWTPGYNQAGTYQLKFKASDESLEDTQVVIIKVENVNRAPLFDDVEDKKITEGSLLSFKVSATDPDKDNLFYSATNLPSGATLSKNGEFSWIPLPGKAGAYQINLKVSDGAEKDTVVVTITVDKLVCTTLKDCPGGYWCDTVKTECLAYDFNALYHSCDTSEASTAEECGIISVAYWSNPQLNLCGDDVPIVVVDSCSGIPKLWYCYLKASCS
ncbi:MAG: putative Ig domain-containing protein [Nanoarchaeota archaeon]|nr:putative Ig domain-containing protein [Nanoarchaeota archaeon]MBU1976814.1 putative Ig domain-containing protein [Nanoarchaeota archaeon]